ncbi:hypothetical protein N425_11395 [Tannerella sp. oral taxon BU063 isolate Cell 2]|uniref:Uncharacterized protein n=1 Tax=Tannerella sp. oral taxon BU063 isolate Cell 2 TaxID=1411148 RepID=W2C3Z0_9BACT|nr:hypothetical protein N425_11395 [Tannerella sp. oral taxon BU063 isolate Cell 2]
MLLAASSSDFFTSLRASDAVKRLDGLIAYLIMLG